MAEDEGKWGTVEGMWKALAPLKAPIPPDAPLSENVEDRRDPDKMLELIMRSVNHVPQPVYNDDNPLLGALKEAARKGYIPGYMKDVP